MSVESQESVEHKQSRTLPQKLMVNKFICQHIIITDHAILVSVPLDAVTATVSSSDIAIAGMIYNLTCTVSKTVDGLLNSPTATWTTAGGGAVSNGNEITVSTMTTDDTAISILTFDPLRTSHEGSYSCDGTLTSPALQAPLTPSAMVEHNVKSILYSPCMYLM